LLERTNSSEEIVSGFLEWGIAAIVVFLFVAF
jgi:hypothetical protein